MAIFGSRYLSCRLSGYLWCLSYHHSRRHEPSQPGAGARSPSRCTYNMGCLIRTRRCPSLYALLSRIRTTLYRGKGSTPAIPHPKGRETLVAFLLLISNLRQPVRIKYIPSLAFSLARRRSTMDKPIKPPGKNWARSFEIRQPQLKARRVRSIDWKRHEKNIYVKITL
jgi:hypothetical protein